MTWRFTILTWIACGTISSISAQTIPPPVSLSVPKPKAEVGQRLPFFVELLSKGPFGGATSFTLPEVPGVILVKVGDPVVSSKPIAGENWFAQTHEFALFSQRDGSVKIPGFPVRFGTRDAISDPVKTIETEVPGMSLEIERPAGTDPHRFLVTTPDYSVEEQWNPLPGGNVKPGAVFKRTITQSAADMTGMALAPAPVAVADGIRIYPGTAEVRDETERGEFSGRRTETLTYLVEQAGRHTLPAIRYDWWNPESKQLESKTLPAVSFVATAPTGSSVQSVSDWRTLGLAGGLVFIASAALAWWFRRAIKRELLRLRDHVDPPRRRAARALLRACRQNHAGAAERAWEKWRSLAPDSPISAELREQTRSLQRNLYGPMAPSSSWRGASLAQAFRHRPRQPAPSDSLVFLPPLNP